MQSLWKLPKLVYRTTQLKFSNVNSNQTNDYDVAANSYDNYYSKYLGQSALELWKKLPVKTEQSILDLACGTGFFTTRLAEKVGTKGKVTAVDLSSGMLECNRAKAQVQNLTNVNFVCSDALSFLAKVPDRSVDGVICAWGICYMEHPKLRQELERVVKPGGFIGLIENKTSSLKEVSDLFTKVLMDYPEAMVKNIALQLPKDKKYLTHAFCQSSFQVQSAWDGEVIIPCQNGREIADYMLKSGASAGFLDALAKDKIAQVFASFIKYADERFSSLNGVLVKHDFCAIVGIKS